MGNKTSSVNDVFKDCLACVAVPETSPENPNGIRVLNIPENNPERPPQNLEYPNSSDPNMSVALFSGCLPKRLEDGDEICLSGVIAEGAGEFSVALVCMNKYSSEIDDIPYFQKVNFEDGSSIINHKINGNWQNELATDPFDVNQGEPFSVQLIIKEDDAILVYCNEQFITKHQVPFQVSVQATHIQIWNGLDRVDSMTVKFA